MDLDLDVSSKSFPKSLSSASKSGNVDQNVCWLGFTNTCFTWIGFIFCRLCGPPSKFREVEGGGGGGGPPIGGGGGGGPAVGGGATAPAVGGGGGGGGPAGAELPASAMVVESLASLCPVSFCRIYTARSEKSMSFEILKIGGF